MPLTGKYVAGTALIATCILFTTAAADGGAFCDTLCQQFQDGSTLPSIGGLIESSFVQGSTNGNGFHAIQGTRLDLTSGLTFYGPSAIWNLWFQAHSQVFPTHITGFGSGNNGGQAASNKICIDEVVLARLTIAATQCHNQLHGSGWQSGFDNGFKWTSTWGTGGSGSTQQTHGQGSSSGGGGASQTGGGGYVSGGSTGQTGGGGYVSGGSTGVSGGSTDQTGGGIVGGGNTHQTGGGGTVGGGSTGQGIIGGSSGGQIVVGGSSTGHADSDTSGSSGGSTGSTSSSGWGHGNVHSTAICFKIKSKETDRYLTTYGSEYAFATLEGYYSVFRGYPAKDVPNGYTLTEINRNGGTVNYPVKLVAATGVFKPYYGDKDAVWTFNPAQFGDSCWGLPGNKKMASRNDWGGWGKNYRQASSGEDCVDIELEEVDC